MNALLATAAEIQHFLQRAGERYCFIGGIALQRWGEPRLTRDVDPTLHQLPVTVFHTSHQSPV